MGDIITRSDTLQHNMWKALVISAIIKGTRWRVVAIFFTPKMIRTWSCAVAKWRNVVDKTTIVHELEQ